jgi:general secretion pathway protein F
MLTALEIAKNVVNQSVYEEAIEHASTQVSEGRGLAVALFQTKVFPPIMIHMIGVGEKTGELEPMLFNVSENYELQVDTTVNALTSLLSPIMIVGMVIFVGFIMMAILGPIFEMNQFAG